MKFVTRTAIATIALGVAASANAATFTNLTNTGGAGNVAWTVSVGGGAATTPVDVTPINPNWVSGEAAGQTDTSAWIANSNYGQNGVATNPATFTYSTSFNAANVGAGDLIGFNWAADNAVTSILLNGVAIYTASPLPANSTTTPANEFGAWKAGSGAGLLNGANSLSFSVLNQTPNGNTAAANPTGFRLNYISSNVAAVPEPATWAMMIAGFGMIGAATRRRRSTATTAHA